MPSQADQDGSLIAGEKLAAISNATVRLLAEYTGRGPTRARTTISGRWVFITLEDTLTKGERQLAANGHGDWVLQTRKHFQSVMQAELQAAVERYTGRQVVAFMSDNHIDPDVAVEVFMLAPDGDPLASEEVSGEI
jgi:uncharacterized protein YbcI